MIIRLQKHIYKTTISSILLIVIALLFSFISQGQVCTGNLGENIFPDGDFGRGNTNVVSTDPQIAPGYDYEPHPPPNDGRYTITNYTGLWNLFPGWIKIRDNSTDIYGYMMVVNASYEPGSFYEKQIDGLCENTLYEFSADIINLMETGSNGIKPDVSFLLNDQVLYSTGNVPENEVWNTYGFTFTTEAGQNSLTLSLENNAPGGMGNDLALDNISFRPCGPEAHIVPEEITNMCEDGNPVLISANLIGNQFDDPSFQWQRSFDEGISWENIPGADNSTYTHNDFSSGFYYYRYLTANGDVNLFNYKCRIVSDIKIINVIPKFNYIIDSICDGLSYPIGDSDYTTSGNYTDSLLNSLGCDSIVYLDLTIMPDLDINIDFEIINPSCSYIENGSVLIDSVFNGTHPYSYIFNGAPYNIDETIYNLAGGSYLYTLYDRYGCGEESSVSIVSPLPFTIDLGEDKEVDLGDPLQIRPSSNSDIENILWQPEDLINCESDCLELDWAPPYSVLVSALATSADNCIASDSVNIIVNKVRKVYMANAFSPNNDGLNDYFTVNGSMPNVQKIVKMTIHNRWGQMIYEDYDFYPNQENTGWDGKYKGEPSELGVYVYQIDILFLDGEIIRYSGNISLIN